MKAITAHPKTEEQVKALIALFKAWDIPYEPKNSIYNPEFVAKIKQSKAEYKGGKSTLLKNDEDIESFIMNGVK